MRILFTLLLTATLVAPVTAATPQKDYDRLYGECTRKAGMMNNTVVHACSEEVSTQAKTEINALYRRFHKQLSESSPEDAATFEKAQKAWLDYRNAHCALAGEYVGTPMYEYCPMKLNIERVTELRELLGE